MDDQMSTIRDEMDVSSLNGSVLRLFPPGPPGTGPPGPPGPGGTPIEVDDDSMTGSPSNIAPYGPHPIHHETQHHDPDEPMYIPPKYKEPSSPRRAAPRSPQTKDNDADEVFKRQRVQEDEETAHAEEAELRKRAKEAAHAAQRAKDQETAKAVQRL